MKPTESRSVSEAPKRVRPSLSKNWFRCPAGEKRLAIRRVAPGSHELRLLRVVGLSTIPLPIGLVTDRAGVAGGHPAWVVEANREDLHPHLTDEIATLHFRVVLLPLCSRTRSGQNGDDNPRGSTSTPRVAGHHRRTGPLGPGGTGGAPAFCCDLTPLSEELDRCTNS
jgi:hypothetical protein